MAPATGDRFHQGDWQTLSTGAPILRDALVGIDCLIESAEVHGTHHVFIGRVTALDSTAADALVYTRRAYSRSAPLV